MKENAVIKGKLFRGDMSALIQEIPSNMVTLLLFAVSYKKNKIFSEGDNSVFVHTSHQKQT